MVASNKPTQVSLNQKGVLVKNVYGQVRIKAKYIEVRRAGHPALEGSQPLTEPAWAFVCLVASLTTLPPTPLSAVIELGLGDFASQPQWQKSDQPLPNPVFGFHSCETQSLFTRALPCGLLSTPELLRKAFVGHQGGSVG